MKTLRTPCIPCIPCTCHIELEDSQLKTILSHRQFLNSLPDSLPSLSSFCRLLPSLSPELCVNNLELMNVLHVPPKSLPVRNHSLYYTQSATAKWLAIKQDSMNNGLWRKIERKMAENDYSELYWNYLSNKRRLFIIYGMYICTKKYIYIFL